MLRILFLGLFFGLTACSAEPHPTTPPANTPSLSPSPGEADPPSPEETAEETAAETAEETAEASPQKTASPGTETSPTPSVTTATRTPTPAATPSPALPTPTLPPGACQNGEEESRACGIYPNGAETRVCENQIWQPWEACICIPHCNDGAICGDDGCGGVCGLECKGDFSCAPDGSHCGPPCPNATALCDDDGCTLDILLETHALFGAITYGEEIMALGGQNAFSIGLFRKDGTQFYGHNLAGSSDYEIRAFEGVYDVQLHFLRPDMVPHQPQSPITVARDLVIDGPTELPMHIPVAQADIQVDILADEDFGPWQVELSFSGEERQVQGRFSLSPGARQTIHLPEDHYRVSAQLRSADGQIEIHHPLSDHFELFGDQTVDFQIPLEPFSSDITFNHKSLADLQSSDEAPLPWRLRLESQDGQTQAQYRLNGPNPPILLAPAQSYRVHFNFGHDDGEHAPTGLPLLWQNLVEDFTLNAGENPTLMGDLEAFLREGEALWDGVAIEDSEGGSAEWVIHAQNIETFQFTTIFMDGGHPEIALWLYPGRYDIYTDLRVPNAVARPITGSHLYARHVDISEDGPLDFHFTPLTVSGEIRQNDVPLPGAAQDEIHLEFRRLDGLGHESYGVNTQGGTFERLLFPGNYQISTEIMGEIYDGQISGRHLIDEELPLFADGTLDLNETLVSLVGTVNYNGQALPISDGKEIWQLIFVNAHNGEELWVDLEGGSDYALEIYPATYDIYMALTAQNIFEIQPEGRIPIAWNQVIEGAETTLNIDPELMPLRGILDIDGEAFPEALDGDGTWRLMVGFPRRQHKLTFELNGGDAFRRLDLPPYTFDFQMEFLPATADDLGLSHEPYDLLFCGTLTAEAESDAPAQD